MKKSKAILGLVILLLTACQTEPVLQTVEIPPTPTESTSPLGDGGFDRSIFLPGLVSSRQAWPDSLDQAAEYEITAAIDDAVSHLDGTAEVRYTNRAAVPLTEIYFRSFPNFFLETPLAITQLSVDGRAVEPAYRLANTVFAVPLPAPLSPGERVAIRFAFSFDIPPADQAPFSLFGFGGGILALDAFFPTVVVHDSDGWSLGDPPQWEENAHAEAAFFVVTVELAGGLAVAASGFEIDRDETGGRQTITFAAGPARGFSLAAGSDLIAQTTAVGETTIRSYAPAELAAGAADALSFAENALATFNARLGAYPYTEFDLVSTPMQASGSASAGFAVFNRTYYEAGDLYDTVPHLNNLERTVAHELAHQWFYNLVGNDYAGEVWFPEAFAQYMTGLYYLDVYGAEEQALYEQDWTARWSEAGSRAVPVGLPVGDYAPGEVRAIVYGRGPLFISALSDRIGAETFDGLLADFFRLHAWELSSGEELKDLAELHCGCDLDVLFVEWVYPEGYAQDEGEGSGEQTLVIQPGLPFETAQAATDFELRFPAFFPEPFEFYGVSLAGSGEAVLNFLKTDPPMRLAILAQTVVGTTSQVTIVMNPEETRIVTVGGVEAAWFADPAGSEAVLDWTIDGVRYRLIGIIDLELALKIAESLE